MVLSGGGGAESLGSWVERGPSNGSAGASAGCQFTGWGELLYWGTEVMSLTRKVAAEEGAAFRRVEWELPVEAIL